MATNTTGTADLPELTVAGIKKLSAQLDADLAAVPLTAAQRPQIETLINQIRPQLAAAAAVASASSADLAVAAASWAPAFAQLAPLLQQTLGQATGACFYQGGCIQATVAECLALGGTPKGGPCP
jgi:hypothetical protein